MSGRVKELSKLTEILSYDPADGSLRWRYTKTPRAICGTAAGALSAKGYLVVRVDGVNYRAHRLAWAIHHGEWPDDSVQIDHINGDRRDNRLSNLRLCTPAENQHNRAPGKNNRSGYLGVSYNAETKKWRASICVSGKRRRVGEYSTAQEAHSAYLAEKAAIHPTAPADRSRVIDSSRSKP